MSEVLNRAQRVLVTAGAGGAGLVTAQRFRREGATVFVCDVDRQALDRLAGHGPGITAIEADVASEDAVDRLFDEIVARSGGLDVLVNNAGISGPTAEIDQISLSDWQRTIQVNLTGPFLCSRRAARLFKEQAYGVIVNVSTVSAKLGLPLRAPYSASKEGVLGLTRTLARELGPFGIRVNAVLPGAIDGERLQRVIRAKADAMGVPDSHIHKELVRYTSMRTTVSADDIADMIVFLASSNASRVTGQMIAVDGNMEWEI